MEETALARKLGAEQLTPVRHTTGDETDVRNAYLEQYPKSAKEASNSWIEKNHIAHLRRLLDVRMPIMEMTARTIQEYIYGEAY